VSVESNSQRVLIVDESAESREVLRTLLERTGTATIEAAGPDEAASLAESLRPHLIVFDVDSDHSLDRDASRRLSDTASRTDTPIVLLGRFTTSSSPLGPRDQLAKPYHYGHLLRKIADVLDARRVA
jgi:CheY-like chemotaxis protein